MCPLSIVLKQHNSKRHEKRSSHSATHSQISLEPFPLNPTVHQLVLKETIQHQPQRIVPTKRGLMDPLTVDLELVGLKPTIPHMEAGIRMDPATSDPRAKGTHPAATSAASPPDEPPGVLSKSHGFLDRPHIAFTDSQSIINCIVFPRQRGRAPAFLNTST